LQRLSKWECKKESCSSRCKWYKARLPFFLKFFFIIVLKLYYVNITYIGLIK
jgi:hypothetical protein